MKFTKLSLIAAVAASTAFAGGDIAPVEPAPVVEATSPWSFSGDAKLYYHTQTDTKIPSQDSIFDQGVSFGQAALSADIGYAINSNWKVNMGLTGLMTLGLDDSVVSGVWLYAGADVSAGDALWIDTLNVTGTMFDGALTMVLGRQELDTPLAFSEKWNIAANTFDAAVALAKPMENVTLVAGYIYDGNGNGPRITTFDGDNSYAGGLYTGTASAGGFTGDSGYFPVGGINKGAWTVAAIANISDVTAQAWYYDVIDVAQAVWLQADTKIAGFTLGAQYSWIGVDDTLNTLAGNTIDDSSAWAVKAGYDIMDNLNVWAAYSSVDSVAAGRDAIPVANTATLFNGAGSLTTGAPAMGWGSTYHSGQSKLYTEAWWNYGLVGQAGADTVAVAANYNVGDFGVLNGINATIQYTDIQDAKLFLYGDNTWDVTEVTAVVGATAYGLNVQLAYIWDDKQETIAAGGTASNVMTEGTTDTVQLYLTYKF